MAFLVPRDLAKPVGFEGTVEQQGRNNERMGRLSTHHSYGPLSV